jgi:asparagine N-glycosylation enzyme membrane subunit Stt3
VGSQKKKKKNLIKKDLWIVLGLLVSVGLAILFNPLGFSVWLILLLVSMSLILLFGCSWNSHGMYDKVEFCSVYFLFFPFSIDCILTSSHLFVAETC